MAKDYMIYVVLAIMIGVIVVAAIAARNYTPPEEIPKNDSGKNSTIDMDPQVSISVQKPMDGAKVTVEAASSTSAKVKVGDESIWVDEGESYIFSNGLSVYIEKINRIGSSKDEFSVELWAA